MDFKDYYKTLGIERTASEEDVRKAYRKLARKYHPDVSKEPDAQARMRDINEANDVLRDKEKRAAYDALADRVAQGYGTGEQEDERERDEEDVQRDLVGGLAPRGALHQRDHPVEEFLPRAPCTTRPAR